MYSVYLSELPTNLISCSVHEGKQWQYNPFVRHGCIIAVCGEISEFWSKQYNPSYSHAGVLSFSVIYKINN